MAYVGMINNKVATKSSGFAKKGLDKKMPVANKPQAAHGKDISRLNEIRQTLRQDTGNYQLVNGKKTFTSKSRIDVLQSGALYSDALRQQRVGTKKSQTALKTLKYSFKSISSKLLRSKTSISARQVASQAKREVTRLKNLKKVEGYDPEELEAAIIHAKAMERLAKKKARHLEEEEMAKVGGACMGEELEKEEMSEEIQEQEDLEELPLEDMSSEEFQAQLDQMIAELEASMDQMMAELEASMDDMMEALEQSMEDMMEDMGLDDLFEDMTGSATDTDPEDLKMMKIKHRSKEQQDQAKADAEYLKAIFKHFEAVKSAGAMNVGNANPMPVLNMTGGSDAVSSVESAVTAEAHIDVSL